MQLELDIVDRIAFPARELYLHISRRDCPRFGEWAWGSQDIPRSWMEQWNRRHGKDVPLDPTSFRSNHVAAMARLYERQHTAS